MRLRQAQKIRTNVLQFRYKPLLPWYPKLRAAQRVIKKHWLKAYTPQPQHNSCATCGRRDVRLYRPYGSFLRDDGIFCNEHITRDFSWYVPLCEDIRDGTVWGYTSVSDESIWWFEKLPDGADDGPCWDMKRSRFEKVD